MTDKTLLKDQLFNAKTVGRLAAEYAVAVPGFDAARFLRMALSGFVERELMARMAWLADCVDAQLADDFHEMADQLEAAMPAALDPARTDDDFGHFIHAVPGILAVRHGLEHHRPRAMTLLYRATQRFSMEFYIRDFLLRWPKETLSQLENWAGDDNYHVRRLVSEGTRPRLPWARNVDLTPAQTLPLLDILQSDRTRYVTRSVANHLNDLSKTVPDTVLDRLERWEETNTQTPSERQWMRKHALRSLIKSGHTRTMQVLGYRPDVEIAVSVSLGAASVTVGQKLEISCALKALEDAPLLIDYRISFARPNGKTTQKVFKLKQINARNGQTYQVKKNHLLKGDATTFVLHPGKHSLCIQVNGTDRCRVDFELTRAV